jgi:hypothetical protein
VKRLPRHANYFGRITDSIEPWCKQQSPWNNEICLQVFKVSWNEDKNESVDLFNQMYMDGKITEQKYGAIVCVPKANGPIAPAEYRPIMLLNTYYKILAGIIVK